MSTVQAFSNGRNRADAHAVFCCGNELCRQQQISTTAAATARIAAPGP